jgi:hypothetical protein
MIGTRQVKYSWQHVQKADACCSAAARGGGFVVIKVIQAVDYHIHRTLLLEHSEYSRKALNGSGKEA